MAQHAKIAYAPKQDMVVGEAAQVRVTASAGEDGFPTTVVSTPAPTIVVTKPLHCEVEALLRGIDFRVDPPDFQLGSFFDQPAIHW